MSKDKQIFTEKELRSVLDDVTFENTSLDFKWKFEIEPISSGLDLSPTLGWFVNVAFERPDTFTGQIGIGRGRKELVQVGAWESGIVKTCWLLVELVVRHELMEAFHWKGKRIFNPHNSIYDLASIQP